MEQPGKSEAEIHRDDRIANMVAAGSSDSEIARTVKVSRGLVGRRRKDPAFMARVTRIRRATLDRCTGRMVWAVDEAVSTLVRLLKCGEPSVEGRAARVLLDATLRYQETVELAERVEELERRLDDQSRPGPRTWAG